LRVRDEAAEKVIQDARQEQEEGTWERTPAKKDAAPQEDNEIPFFRGNQVVDKEKQG